MSTDGSKKQAGSTPDLDKTIEKMDKRIKRYSQNNDRRERFLLMYRTFKNELRANLQRGRFLDSEWSEAICCRMGAMYFEANEAYQNNTGRCPESWRICFDAARGRKTNLLQDALMGMNAHINYDLTVCVYDVMKENGDFLQTEQRLLVDRKLSSLLKKRYYDYLLINQIAWESIPLIQDVLTERFSKLLGLLNKASLRFSKAMVEKLILEYRDRAWTHALLLLSAKDREEHNTIRRFMDELAVSNTKLIREFVSYNPLNLIRPVIQPEVLEEESEKKLNTVTADLLKEKLMQRETAEYASRTLVEYGRAAIPFLEKMLKNESQNKIPTKQLYRILGEISNTESAELLAFSVTDEADQPHELFKAALKQEEEDIRTYFKTDVLYDLLGNVLYSYLRNLRIAADLEVFPANSLLKRSLTDRRNRHKESIKAILKILLIIAGVPKDETEIFHYKSCDSMVSRELGGEWSAVISNIFEGQLTELLNFAEQHFNLKTRSAEDCIREFVKDGDEWLKCCAVKDINSGEFEHEISIQAKVDQSMISTVEKVLYLKNVELFNEIPAEELTSIAKVAQEHTFPKNEYLIRQGNPGKNLYVITRGTVKVEKDGAVITELKENDVLGEISLLTESSTSADCIAKTETKTLKISQDDFLDFLYEGYPEIALGLIRVLIKRLEDTTAQLDSVPVQL